MTPEDETESLLRAARARMEARIGTLDPAHPAITETYCLHTLHMLRGALAYLRQGQEGLFGIWMQAALAHEIADRAMAGVLVADEDQRLEALSDLLIELSLVTTTFLHQEPMPIPARAPHESEGPSWHGSDLLKAVLRLEAQAGIEAGITDLQRDPSGPAILRAAQAAWQSRLN